MNRSIIILPLVAMVLMMSMLCSCGNSSKKQIDSSADSLSITSEADVIDSVEVETIESDTIMSKIVTFHKKEVGDNGIIEVEMYAEIPESDNERLDNRIKHFLYTCLKDEFTWDGDSLGSNFTEYKDGQATIDFYGKAKLEELSLMGGGKDCAYMKKVYENENLVSYKIEFVSYGFDSDGNVGKIAKSKKFYQTYQKNDAEWFKIRPTNEGTNGLCNYLWNKVHNNVVNDPHSLFKRDVWFGGNYLALKDGILLTYEKNPYYQVDGEFFLPYSDIKRYLDNETLGLLAITDDISNDGNNTSDNLDWLQGHWVYRQGNYEAHLVFMENTVRQFSTLNPEPTYYTYRLYDNQLKIIPIKNDGTDFVVKLDFSNHRIDYGDGNWMHKIN